MKQALVSVKHAIGRIYSSLYREVRYALGKSMRGDYQIAYRKISSGGLLANEPGEFRMIPNLRQGFSADPFLFEHKGALYLFAEIMNNKKGVGEIGYCKWNGKRFGRWKVIISEPHHLSYPLVFQENEEIYIMPEAKASHSLYLYKAKSFPNAWERVEPIVSGCDMCDTTLFEHQDQKLAFTTVYDEQGSHLRLLKFNDSLDQVIWHKELTDDGRISRCGGHVVSENGRYIRVAQDCSRMYGEKLIFLELSVDEEGNYQEKVCQTISADEIKINKQMKVSRIHTYNACSGMEVIDLFRG